MAIQKIVQSPIDAIEVYYDGFGEHRLIGYVTLQNNRPVFGYDPSWLASGYELSPIEMPLQSKLYQGKHHSSQYLCGLIADSLPDGWGLLHKFLFFPLWERSCVLSHEFPIMGIRAITGIALSRLTAH